MEKLQMPKTPDFMQNKDFNDLIKKKRRALPETGWNNVGPDEDHGVDFENSWANSGPSTIPASWYLSENGEVRLRGKITGGETGTTIFTLPEEVRPEFKERFIIPIEDDVHLENIRFRAFSGGTGIPEVINEGAIKIVSPLTGANYNHYFHTTLLSPTDGYWIGFDVAFTDDYLNQQEATEGGADGFMSASSNTSFSGGYAFGTVNDTGGPGINPLGWWVDETHDLDTNIFSFSPLTWYHVDYHSDHPNLGDPHILDIYIDGSPLTITHTNPFNSSTTASDVFWGLRNYNGYDTLGFTSPLSIYLKQMVVGTSQGEHDIFDGRFLNTANWPFNGSSTDDPNWTIYDSPPF
jgi:hypothetical protein